ncbi:MAG: proton-conducting transporter membrane subunit [Candidatus Lightella neohaematopini]|nr:proton-conducting transporter membrane subunit [Candidatus Lightella neohaematopini]
MIYEYFNTMINYELFTLLPLIIIGGSIFLVTCTIILNCTTVINYIITIVGVFCALITTIINKHNIININNLIVINSHTKLFNILILIISIINIMQINNWMKLSNIKYDEVYLFILITIISSYLLINTNHLAVILLCMELTSISLIGVLNYKTSYYIVSISIKYMIISVVTLLLIMLGTLLIYNSSHSLLLITRHIISNEQIYTSGLIILLIGICFKLSLVPCHLWISSIYQHVPIPILVILNITVKLATFVILFKLILYTLLSNNDFVHIVMAISVLSITIGNFMTLSQTNLRKIIAYSSISHIGYLSIGLVIAYYNNNFIPIVFSNIVNYIITNLNIITIIHIITNYRDKKHNMLSLSSYYGIFYKYPLLTSLLIVNILSLSGIPITLGFINKFYMFLYISNYHIWWLMITMVVTTIISFVYYLRIIGSTYKQINYNNVISYDITKIICLIYTIILSLLLLILGVCPNLLFNLFKTYM